MTSQRIPAADIVREEDLDLDALHVIRRLVEAGHEAYLVGGCVRDLLVGRRPKDFDIATSATPRQVRRLFTNSRVIGRRFLLAHVAFEDKIIEVSTFRQSPDVEKAQKDDGDHLITRDNVFGTAEDDAIRRDFTINGLFYDPEKKAIVDHVGGMADVKQRLMRTIGNASVRIQEDPVRIIRAARLCAQVGFRLDPDLREAMTTYSEHIMKSAPPRVQEEIFRTLESGVAEEAIRTLIEVGCFRHVYPQLAEIGIDVGRLEEHPSRGAPAEADDDDEDLADGDWDDDEPIPEDQFLDWDMSRFDDEGEPPGLTPDVPSYSSPSPAGARKRTQARPGELTEVAKEFLELLGCLDDVVREKGRPPRPVLLAVLILKWVRSREHGKDTFRSTWDYLGNFRLNNRVSRKDAELCSQVIAAQRRIFGDSGARRGRRRPDQLLHLRYFPAALAVADIETRASGQGRSVVARWAERMRSEGLDPDEIFTTLPSQLEPAGLSPRSRPARTRSGRSRRADPGRGERGDRGDGGDRGGRGRGRRRGRGRGPDREPRELREVDETFEREKREEEERRGEEPKEEEIVAEGESPRGQGRRRSGGRGRGGRPGEGSRGGDRPSRTGPDDRGGDRPRDEADRRPREDAPGAPRREDTPVAPRREDTPVAPRQEDREARPPREPVRDREGRPEGDRGAESGPERAADRGADRGADRARSPDAGDRGPRQERGERREGGPRQDRGGRRDGRGRGRGGDRGGRSDRGPRSDRGERRDRPDRDGGGRPPRAPRDGEAPVANIRRPEKVEEESSAAKKYKSRGWVRVLKHGQKPKRRRAQRKRV